MKKLVIVGTGQRGYEFFATKIKERYCNTVQIVGIYDNNQKRAQYYQKTINKDIKVFDDFDKMLDQTKPDIVLVTTVDGLHHKYIIRALDKGYNVLSEKPLTTTEENCLAIREAERRSGKKVSVTFNCRFMPYFARIKEVLMSGVIGKPLSIHYEYVLNTKHGGDYFKRWHRFMKNSGGMLVHKSTHHFDIINWLLQDDPVSVSAQGARLYFGNDDRPHGERCLGCQYANTCESYVCFSEDENVKEMYYNSEDVDGYLRDHCSFKSDTDIYDSMSVSVAYRKGTLLTYSLNLFSTDEGYTLNIIGEKGRIEASTFFAEDKHKLIVKYRNGRVDEITFPKSKGGHDGGDDRMLDMFFGGVTDDPLGQCSDSYDGIKSVLIGVSANKSIKEGRRIDLTETLEKLR